MKKTKFLALSLVVALGLTGTAFAYWGQDIVSNTTVNTGKLEVAVDGASCKAYAYTWGGDNVDPEWYAWVIADYGTLEKAKDLVPRYIQKEYQQTSVSNKNVVTAKVANMYPGSKLNLVYKVQNTGSIPVKINNIALDGISGDLAQHYSFEVQIVNEKTNVTIWSSGRQTYDTLTANSFDLSGLDKEIDPREKVIVSIFASFDEDITDDMLSGDDHEMSNFTFKATTGFTQFNAE